ncbi:MAG: formylglycine-generating enzyme family protein [Magnetococcus sp. WYHC-3]
MALPHVTPGFYLGNRRGSIPAVDLRAIPGFTRRQDALWSSSRQKARTMKDMIIAIQQQLQLSRDRDPPHPELTLAAPILAALGWQLHDPVEFQPRSHSTPRGAAWTFDLCPTPGSGVAVRLTWLPRGSLTRDLRPEGQNGLHFHVVSDGMQWRFLFQKSGESAPGVVLKTLDWSSAAPDEVENLLAAYLARAAHVDGKARERVEKRMELAQRKRQEVLVRLMPKALSAQQRQPDLALEDILSQMAERAGSPFPLAEVREFVRQARDQGSVARSLDKVPATPAAREWVEPITGMPFVWIPPGVFMMGSPETEVGRQPDEGPLHQVSLDGFWMARYPVTRGQWRRVMDSVEYTRRGSRAEQTAAPILTVEVGKAAWSNPDILPMDTVLWEHIAPFLEKLALLGGGQSNLRLPSEAEWEYAARGGQPGRFFFDEKKGEQLGDYAWHVANSQGRLQPIGQLKPNPFGLHDILGNVWEWTGDFHAPYSADPRTNPRGPATGREHVRRGGSFRSNLKACRPARRNQAPVEELEINNSGALGIRLVRPG